MTEGIGLVVCIVLSAFFSAAETSLLSLSSHRIEILSEANSRNRRLFRLWLDRPNQMLTTILIGNNVVNITATALSVRMADALIGKHALIYAIVLMTCLIVFFGEVVPKVFGRYNADFLSVFALRILAVMHTIFRPIVVPIGKLTHRLIEATGKQAIQIGTGITEEEFLHYLELAQLSGALEEEEGEMITSALRFYEKRVRDIMIPRNEVMSVPAEISYRSLVDTIKKYQHSRYPVYFKNMDHIVGVVHAKDVLAFDQQPHVFSIHRYLRQPYIVSEMRRIDKVFQGMKTKKTHLAIVRDENNQFVGIVTMEDILEELVGEISDEHDIEGVAAEAPIRDRFVDVEGGMSILELEKVADVELPKSVAYSNVNGLILYLTGGELPKEGTRIIFGVLEFIILRTDKRAFIEQVRVKKHAYDFGSSSGA